jgi:hypothetical protein
MFKIKHNLDKLSFLFKRTSIRNYSKNISSDDEVESLNNEIKLLKLSSKKKFIPDLSFEHDPLEMNKQKHIDKKEVDDLKLKLKITKISEAQRVCIREDEDISKYKIIKHRDQDLNSLLDAIFEKGTNHNFVKKLDKICEIVNEEEFQSIAGFQTSKIGGLDYIEKDLSDIEESINLEVEKFFENTTKKLEIPKFKKVKTIEEYLEKSPHLEKNKNEIETKIKINQPLTEINQYVKKNNLINDSSSFQQQQQIESKQNLHLNKTSKESIVLKEFDNPLKLELQFKKFDFINPSQNDPERKPKKISTKKQSLASENLFTVSSNKNPSHLKYKTQTESIEAKFENYLLKKTLRKFDMLYFKTLNFNFTEDSFIQKEIISKNHSHVELFNDMYKKLCYTKEYTDKKTKRVYYKSVIREDPLNSIKRNYQLKIISGKYYARLFNETFLSFDKNRIDLILLKLKSSKENLINFLLASTKTSNGDNVGVVTIFDGLNQTGAILINLGEFSNINFTPFYLHLIALQIIEIIQLNSDNLSHIEHFNIIIDSSSFNFESKISIITNNLATKFISLLLESKLEKFKTKRLNNEIMDPELNLNNSSFISNIPNIKFFNYRDINRKYILQYLRGAAKLDINSINIKL